LGLNTSSLTLPAQLWTQDSDGVPGVSEQDDQFGYALAWGDFNGDHYDDLCIGVPLEQIPPNTTGGAVTCLYGSPNGLQSSGVNAPLPQLWDANNLLPSGALGYSLVSGDFNHDGYADLCIGDPYYAPTLDTFNAGQVECLYGSSSGLKI